MDKPQRDRRDFLIPGLLPYGYLLLLHGDPGVASRPRRWR